MAHGASSQAAWVAAPEHLSQRPLDTCFYGAWSEQWGGGPPACVVELRSALRDLKPSILCCLG